MKPQYLNSLALLILLTTYAQIGAAAPDERGAMGTVFTLSAGGFLSAGTDELGERSSSQIGGALHLLIGEEVLRRLFVGISFDNYFGTTQGQETQTSQLYSFGLEGRYRLSPKNRGLFLIGGLGIGVGGLIGEEESLTDADGASGGSVWKLGLGYELGTPDSTQGFIYAPNLTFQRLGPQMDSEVSMNLISLNLEVLYAMGR